jgi:hypothetical protein
MPTPLAALQVVMRLVLLLALLLALGEQLVSYGPTLGDPDPEGNVSHAAGLAQSWTLQASRRLPGYPALIVATRQVLPYDVPWAMFYAHFVMTILFAAATTAVVWRYLGFWVAATYLAILSINSHFARTAITMFSDLPFTVLLYVMLPLAVAVMLSTGVRRWLALGGFGVLALLAYVVHPSGDMRIQLFVWTAIGVFGLIAIVRRGIGQWRAILVGLVPLVALSVTSYAASQTVQRLFQLTDTADTVGDLSRSPSSQSFLRDWVTYRMLLCLPPTQTPSPLDLRIEEVKQRIAARQGYPVEAIVPPGFAREFHEFILAEPVPRAIWRPRLLAHPLALPVCALREMRSKWHFLVRNLTPFTNFQTDKTFLTPDYPPRTPGWRDDIFWTTGISLNRIVAADAPTARIAQALEWELWRIAVVLGWILVGLVLLDLRYPRSGIIFGIGTLGWFALLSFGVPVETRYFMPNMPVIYLAQAVALIGLLRLVVVHLLGAPVRRFLGRP